MNTKIKKLSFYCGCFWIGILSHTSACPLTMDSVLRRVNLTTADLQLVGVYEEAESILQGESERASQAISALNVSPQYFAARRSAILNKAEWDAALAIQRLCFRRREELGKQKQEQNAALGHQLQLERWRRKAETKLLKESHPPKDPQDPQ